MIGAIAGDMIGSPYERHPIKTRDFEIIVSGFTDDTVLTVAVANSILTGAGYAESIIDFAQRYPNSGYGASFRDWMWSGDPKPYNSWGNGSAMRVSPVGFAFETVDEVLEEAKRSAEVTHNHPEGTRGAQATALAIFLARKVGNKKIIRDEIAGRFPYDMNRTVDEIRHGYRFDVSCHGSVPESIISFLDSWSYESAIKNAISLGGDADTMACIAGGIAQAYYRDIPGWIVEAVSEKLPADLMEVVVSFQEKFGCGV
ncbi:MAG: ADP-ribosylglycohydrolase family protein [Desulfobacterales bacterium]|jgi:ADP-ribosylglycohydrolase|nr:ADP-ribosylglycohydrolase family protein [Desulfobacterales bacterium]